MTTNSHPKTHLLQEMIDVQDQITALYEKIGTKVYEITSLKEALRDLTQERNALYKRKEELFNQLNVQTPFILRREGVLYIVDVEFIYGDTHYLVKQAQVIEV